jgi:CheY-like chemotaxis protein
MSGTRILFVEDDAFKRERIYECIRQLNGPTTITTAMSVQTAVAALSAHEFDIVLLDMALPSHESRRGGGAVSSMLSGGMEVIMELSFLERKERVIIITQYPEIEVEGELVPIARVEQVLKRTFNVNLSGVVHYEHEEKGWEAALIRAIG